MAIPVAYNLRSAQRALDAPRWSPCSGSPAPSASSSPCWPSPAASRRTVTSSGLPQNAIVQRSGSDTEMTSILSVEDVRSSRTRRRWPGSTAGPLVSPEVVVIAADPAARDGHRRQRAGARGLAARARGARQREDRRGAVPPARPRRGRDRQGSAATPTRASTSARRCGSAAGTWTIVGVFDGKGTAFDSEVWADASVLERLLPAAHERVPVGHRPPAVEGRLPGASRRRSRATRG